MKSRKEIVEMVKAWTPAEDMEPIDSALYERHKAHGEGSGDGLLSWAMSGLASAVRNYRDECLSDRVTFDDAQTALRCGVRVRSLTGLSAPRASRRDVWHEKVADAQAALARIVETYAAMEAP